MGEVFQKQIRINKCKTSFSGPITALSFISKDFLIAGEGSYLKIYSAKQKSCLLITKVFSESRIHNFKEISRNENSVLLLALGGKTVRVLSAFINKDNVRINFESHERKFYTWIWDVVQIATKDCNRGTKKTKLALITSQNWVFLWDFSSNEEKVASSCADQCILYSASLWGSTFCNLVAAVGTVFNEVLLWNPFHSTCSEDVNSSSAINADVNVYKRLKGHEGVIFSVVFTTDGKRLLSVSDDRSIRHWDLATGECLQVLYGHIARVWDAKFLHEFIVSIGEDATCIVWDKTSNLVKKFKGHQGKSIWSLATQDNPVMVATGGGDSSIRVWSLEALLSLDNIMAEVVGIPCCKEQTTDFPRNIRILSFKEMLVLTNNGCLLTYNTRETGEQLGKWNLLFKDNEFARYSCIDINRKKRLALIGNLHGKMRIIRIYDAKYKDVAVFDGKITSTFVLENDPVTSNNEVFLAACGTDGIIKLFRAIFERGDFHMDEMGSFMLPYCRQRWAVDCKLIWIRNGSLTEAGNSCSKNSDHELAYSLIVGDRKGSIHVFHGGHIRTASQKERNPAQSFLSVHGKAGVTRIIHYNQWIYSTGRDGSYQKFLLSDDGSLTILERKRACKGMDWISGLTVTMHDDILIYGFYLQSHFVVWSTRRNDIIQKIHCGGGYRSWDFIMTSSHNSRQNEMMFVYLKGSEIMICDLAANENQTILKEGLHGRELTCIYPLGQLQTGGFVFATGSEDTRLNIAVYNYETNDLKVIHRIDSHVGSIKSIAFVMDHSMSWCKSRMAVTRERKPPNDNSFKTYADYINNSLPYLLFTCGSRTSLKCTCITFDGRGDHINSFVVSEIGNRDKRKRDKEKSNDLRFMSLQVISLDMYKNFEQLGQFYCIVVGCSDGYIRIYGFSSVTGIFCLVMATGFHKRCVQVVKHFRCTIQSQEHHFVLSASTDGRIALWDITKCIDAFVLKNCIAESNPNGERQPYFPNEGEALYNADDQYNEGKSGGGDGGRGRGRGGSRVRDGGGDGGGGDGGGGCGNGGSGDGCSGDGGGDGGSGGDGGGFGSSGDGGDGGDGDDGGDGGGGDGDDGGGGGSGDGGGGDGGGSGDGGIIDIGSEEDCNDDDFSEDYEFNACESENQFSYRTAETDSVYEIKKRHNFHNSIQLHGNNPVCIDSHKPLHVFNAHQSGIHSLSVINDQDASCVFASGGDDNAIFTSKISFSKDLDQLVCNVHLTGGNKFGHHSTITGVKLIRPDLLITCSIDQRLKVWSSNHIVAKHNTNEIGWNILATCYSDVADPSDMTCCIQKDKIVVTICGIGLEMQTFEILK